MGDRKPGASLLRTAIQILVEQGAVVLPAEWDAEYALTEMNVWLRTNFTRGKLVEHTSLGAEGIVGAKVRAIVLRTLDDPGKSSGREGKRKS